MKLDPTALGSLMESVGQGNPMVKGVTELLVSALGEDDEAEEKAREARRQRARQRLRRIQRAIQAHARRNAFLAGALGACECWGEDASCPDCDGRGRAGFFEPDPAAFHAIVAPLLASGRGPFGADPQDRESKPRGDAWPISEEES